MFLSTIASTGIRSWKAVSTEAGKALRRPPPALASALLLLQGERHWRLLFTENVLIGFPGRNRRSEFKKFWSEDVWSWEKGFWSYLTLTSEGRHILLCLLSIFCHPGVSKYFFFYCEVPVCLWASVSVGISAVCMRTVDKMCLSFLTAPTAITRWLWILLIWN